MLKILAPSSVLKIMMAFTEYRVIPGDILTVVLGLDVELASGCCSSRYSYIDISGQSQHDIAARCVGLGQHLRWG